MRKGDERVIAGELGVLQVTPGWASFTSENMLDVIDTANPVIFRIGTADRLGGQRRGSARIDGRSREDPRDCSAASSFSGSA